MSELYKNVEVGPASWELDDGTWRVRVALTKHSDIERETREKIYESDAVCQNQHQANALAIEFGRKLVDEGRPEIGADTTVTLK